MRTDDLGARVSTLLRQTPGNIGLYTSAELSNVLNDAQLQVCVDTNVLRRFGSVWTVANTYRYPLSASTTCPDLLALHNVMWNDTPLGTSRPDDPRWSYASDRATGSPYLYRIWNKNIELYPTPTEAKELRIMYYGYPTTLSCAAQEPEIPVEYQQAMIQYAASLLSVKDEKESRNNAFYVRYAKMITRLLSMSRGYDSEDAIPLDPTVNSARRHTY